MPKKKKPSQASGLAPGPSKHQKRKPAKKPWDKAVDTAQKASSWLNPFD